MRNASLVASVTRYKDTACFIKWLSRLPRKYSIELVINLVKIARKGRYFLWTEKQGIKILK